MSFGKWLIGSVMQYQLCILCSRMYVESDTCDKEFYYLILLPPNPRHFPTSYDRYLIYSMITTTTTTSTNNSNYLRLKLTVPLQRLAISEHLLSMVPCFVLKDKSYENVFGIHVPYFSLCFMNQTIMGGNGVGGLDRVLDAVGNVSTRTVQDKD